MFTSQLTHKNHLHLNISDPRSVACDIIKRICSHRFPSSTLLHCGRRAKRAVCASLEGVGDAQGNSKITFLGFGGWQRGAVEAKRCVRRVLSCLRCTGLLPPSLYLATLHPALDSLSAAASLDRSKAMTTNDDDAARPQQLLRLRLLDSSATLCALPSLVRCRSLPVCHLTSAQLSPLADRLLTDDEQEG